MGPTATRKCVICNHVSPLLLLVNQQRIMRREGKIYTAGIRLRAGWEISGFGHHVVEAVAFLGSSSVKQLLFARG